MVRRVTSRAYVTKMVTRLLQALAVQQKSRRCWSRRQRLLGSLTRKGGDQRQRLS